MKVNPKQSFPKKWLEQHKKQLPIIITFFGLNLLLILIVHGLNPEIGSYEIFLAEMVWLSDIFFLPLAGLNAVLFGTLLLDEKWKTSWKYIFYRLFFAVVGVALVSTGLEFFYASLGYIDDDHIVLGDFKADPLWTNVITYSFIALVIALPALIWRRRLDRLNSIIDEKEVEQEKLTQLKVQAELHALQSRINPHFLFNSFNSIASLISIDPKGAENMVVNLSELFRYSLNSQETNFVSIEEELNIVEIYLNIEKVRFGENLAYELDVDKDLYQEKIPRFLLQPLVENAIKHALSKIKKGKLKVQIQKVNGLLEIKVYDNGPDFPVPKKLGYGLKSTYDKLKLLYPDGHQLGFNNGSEKCVYISLNQNNKELENV